jgi:hypothetical protein
MRQVNGSKDWVPATLNLFELNAPAFSLLSTPFDGRELPDVDLDALCEAIFSHIDGPPNVLASAQVQEGLDQRAVVAGRE